MKLLSYVSLLILIGAVGSAVGSYTSVRACVCVVLYFRLIFVDVGVVIITLEDTSSLFPLISCHQQCQCGRHAGIRPGSTLPPVLDFCCKGDELSKNINFFIVLIWKQNNNMAAE